MIGFEPLWPTPTESWSAKTTSAAFLRQIWFTDCRSIKETLLNPKATSHAGTRLSIEIASLRQSLWRSKGDLTGAPYVQDEPPEEPTDKVRWLDTDVMIADPLTKLMESEKLTDLHIENQPLGHSTAPSCNFDQKSETIETPKDRTYRDRYPAGSISS